MMGENPHESKAGMSTGVIGSLISYICPVRVWIPLNYLYLQSTFMDEIKVLTFLQYLKKVRDKSYKDQEENMDKIKDNNTSAVNRQIAVQLTVVNLAESQVYDTLII